MYQTLTDGEGADLGPRVGYTPFSVSFHTIIYKTGQNKHHMSHRFLLPENIRGEMLKRYGT